MSSTRKHLLVAAICGVICDGSKEQVGTSIDFSRVTIMRHIKDCALCKQCSNSKLNVNQITRDLRSQVESIHQRLHEATSAGANTLITRYLPHYSTKQKSYTCMKCLYTTPKKGRLNSHVNSAKSKCRGSMADLNPSGTYSNKCNGTALNTEALEHIKKGKFVLPWKVNSDLKSPPEQIGQNIANTVKDTTKIQSPNNTKSTIAITPSPKTKGSYKDKNIFSASSEEMERVCQTDYTPVSTQKYSLIIQELSSCFGEDKLPGAQSYLKSFLHRMEGEGQLKAFLNKGLVAMAPNIYDPSKDDITLKVLLISGEQWLKSEAANNHVRQLGADIRSSLYSIGQVKLDNDDELVTGKTFVPTKDVGDIVSVFKRLMIYLVRIQWDGIKDHMMQISDILHCDCSGGGEDESTWHNIVAERIVDTNIIPGILMRITLDKPSVPNGPTIINDFIAMRSISVNAEKEMAVRSGNEFSKEMNSLLRLSRHGVASYFDKSQQRMTAANSSDDEFRNHVQNTLTQVTSSRFTISRLEGIRRGIEISKKSPTNVYKGHCLISGEVMVGQVVIPQIIWGRAIPFLIELLDEPFRELFNCHDLLSAWLDTKNRINWAGQHSTITLRTNQDSLRTISLTDIKPILDSTKQQYIEVIWETLRGAMSYLSSGATRGQEGGRLPPINNWVLVFNVLRFQTYSLKNESHGQANNLMVNRYLPPSISRYTLIAFFCLYPAVESHISLSVPDDDRAVDAADKTFKLMMHLDEAAGPKINRDIIGVLSNSHFPKNKRRITTIDACAKQFSHSSKIHNEYYSSEEYMRLADGSIIGQELLIARGFHLIFGEPESSYGNASNIRVEDGSTVYDELLSEAARHAYRNISANVNQIQLQSILSIDDLSNRKNVIILAGCGTGKSGIYILPHIAREIRGMAKRKTLVISPHNPLLYQHYEQARKYFQGFNLTVVSIENIDEVSGPEFPKNFDLGFISIYNFHRLGKTVINGWKLNTIFIDKIHLMFSECFRYADSWIALRNLAGFGTKIVCMSATVSPELCHHIKHFMKLGDTAFIGNPSETPYKIPDIAISVFESDQSTIMSRVGQHVVDNFRSMNDNLTNQTRGIHVITRTRQQAMDGAQYCKVNNIKAIWITSECSKAERRERMNKYNTLGIDIIWTTYDVGYDSPITYMAVLMEPNSVVSFIQGAGRIRPQQQQALKTEGRLSQVHVFLTPMTIDSSDSVKDEVSVLTRYTMLDENIRINARLRVYISLFSNRPMRNILTGNKCLRKTMYSKIGVTSSDCGLCSVCKDTDNISRMRRVATDEIRCQENDRELYSLSGGDH